MKAKITSYKTISRLNSFDDGILANLKATDFTETIHPNYKEVIPPALIRRMSMVIRMGVGAALATAEDDELGGIVVGTGLGCLLNTEKFLDQFVGRDEGILAPTSFIQSTHNTIAGQIGLILKANCYNSTYTQRGVSFENALTDAIMLANECDQKIICGGVDEKTELMSELGAKVNLDLSNLSEGATFLALKSNADSKVTIHAPQVVRCNPADVKKEIEKYQQKLNVNSAEKILTGNSLLEANPIDGIEESENYSLQSGNYMCNSGFGVQMAAELIETAETKSVLVVNNFANKTFGLTYLESEA